MTIASANNVFLGALPVNIHLFKANNRNSRKRCEICSKLTIKTPKRRQWPGSDVFTVNFEHIYTFRVSIVDFEQVNVSCFIDNSAHSRYKSDDCYCKLWICYHLHVAQFNCIPKDMFS